MGKPTPKRLLTLGIAILVFSVIGFLTLLSFRGTDPVRLFHRIEMGMPYAEAETMLASAMTKETDEATLGNLTILRMAGAFPLGQARGDRSEAWYRLPYCILVIIDQHDRVVGAALLVQGEPRLFDRLRSWIGF